MTNPESMSCSMGTDWLVPKSARRRRGLLSPPPVSVVPEVPGRASRQEKEREGIEIASKATFVADDMVLYIENPVSHFNQY